MTDRLVSATLLDALRAEAAAHRSLVDSLPVALVWLSRDGELLGCNRLAYRLARQTAWFSLVQRRLTWRLTAHAGLVDACVRSAAANVDSSAVLLDNGHPVLSIVTRLVRIAAIPLVPEEERIALQIAPVDSVRPMTAASLRSVYGLTPSEARLASHLAVRRDLRRAAADAGITVTTARSYLKSIFAKTGTRRQTALLQLLWNRAGDVSKGPDISGQEGSDG